MHMTGNCSGAMILKASITSPKAHSMESGEKPLATNIVKQSKNLVQHPKRRHTFIPIGMAICGVALVLSLFLSQQSTSYAAGKAYVRLNQVGYITSETKQAILLASGNDKGATYSLVNTSTGKAAYSGTIGASQGKWRAAFPNSYLI